MSPENQNRQMSCPLWMLLLLLIGAVLLYLLYKHAATEKAQYIQEDIKNRTQAALSENDAFQQISVSADGRDITLSGTTSTEEDKNQANLMAGGIFGVRQVSNLISLQTSTEISSETTKEVAEEADFSSSAKVDPLPEKFLPLPEESNDAEKATARDNSAKAVTEQLEQLDFSNITFEKNSSDLTKQAIDTLDIAVETLRNNPTVRVRIEGHTDSSGSPELNLTISKQRAASVFEYFVNSGIDSARMEAEGFGDQNPIASNDTADGRIKNRRIEIKVMNGE